MPPKADFQLSVACASVSPVDYAAVLAERAAPLSLSNIRSCRAGRAAATWQIQHRSVPGDSEAAKLNWVNDLPGGSSDKDSLRRVLDADGWQDSAEISYYEAFADPDYVSLETARRRFRGQYLGRLRRRSQRPKQAG